MNYKLKVCGLRDPENIVEISALHPDYMGFIFYPGSKRYVGENFDPKILDRIHASICKVGVFVNEPIDSLFTKAIEYQLDYIQLHGNESVEYCMDLYDRGFLLIKAFGIDGQFDFLSLANYIPFCQYFLFDTKTDNYGGSGQKFNWEILRSYNNLIPVFLSGGIDVDDLQSIKNIKFLNIHAIDINSRFEKNPGLKDIEKVKRFIETMNKG